jgi:hypothetical protein
VSYQDDLQLRLDYLQPRARRVKARNIVQDGPGASVEIRSSSTTSVLATWKPASMTDLEHRRAWRGAALAALLTGIGVAVVLLALASWQTN